MLLLRSHRLIMEDPPTPSCHASTLLPLPGGRLLAAWFGGSREGRDDVGIWLAVREGGVFSAPRRLAQGAEPHWNPVLFAGADGRVVLCYKVGRRIPDWRTLLIESRDGGETWSSPRELVPGDRSGGRGPVRCKPLRLQSGRLVAPASLERGLWRCFMDLSDDDGATWRRTEPLAVPGLGAYEAELLAWMRSGEEARPAHLAHGRGIIQPTLWESESGLHALMRSGEGCLYRSDSTDAGETWSIPRPTSVPNNNSGADLVPLPDGSLLLCCNPVGDNFGARTPLRLLRSLDDGESWTPLADVESGPGEYSYPALVRAGGRVCLSYTWRRENIALWEFDWEE